MTAYAETFPRRSRSRRVARRCAGGGPAARERAAARRRDREVRARHLLLQRRGGDALAGEECQLVTRRATSPRTTCSRDERRTSPTTWSPGSRTTATIYLVNFANPDMVGHTGVIPAAVQAVETADAAWPASSRPSRPATASPRDRRPRQRRDDADPGRLAAHGAHHEPGAADRHRPGVRLREGGRLADLAPTALELLGLPPPAVMTGQSLLDR